jgi:glycine dehydrogenase
MTSILRQDDNLQTTFADRHIGTTPADQRAMLDAVGQPSLDALVRAAIPESIHAAPVTDSPSARPRRSRNSVEWQAATPCAAR